MADIFNQIIFKEIKTVPLTFIIKIAQFFDGL
jgi:hypothetical protein